MVILREDYLERIRHLSETMHFHSALQKVVDLLDLLRVATVDVIEAIQEWRRPQKGAHPFIWNGIDYLLKIPSDLDFLQKVLKSVSL